MFDAGIYPVITEKFCSGRSSLEVLREVIKGGAKVVQLREKEYSKKKLYQLALEYRKITKENNVTLIINDHLDIALSIKADGVHLGQNDLPCSAAKKIAPNLIIGVSTHSLQQALKAVDGGADYINIGPIFSTLTKETCVSPLGMNMIKRIKEKTHLPFTVMGGIKEQHIIPLIQAGAARIAMVTKITQAKDIANTTNKLQNIILQEAQNK